MLVSFFAAWTLAQLTHAPNQSDEAFGSVVLDGVVYTELDNDSDLCTATYEFVGNLAEALTQTPQMGALIESEEFAAVNQTLIDLNMSNCAGESLEPQPGDSPDCLLRRSSAKSAIERLEASHLYGEVRALPHLKRMQTTLDGGVEDGCYDIVAP